MKARIRKRIKLIPLEELSLRSRKEEKRRKVREKKKEDYHKFYARKAMTPAEWEAMQAKHRKD